MMQGGRPPILVLNTNTKRETGRKAQLNNIQAAKTVADVVRTCLGPKAMLKMILSMSGSILLTADGNSILREIDVSSPSAKSMIELSRAQDEEVGDGTTSVTILSGEILSMAEPWLEKNMHPRTIIMGYTRALQDALEHMKSISVPVDTNNRDQMLNIVKKCLGTKFVSGYFPQNIADMALDAVRTVLVDNEGRRDIDIKRFVRVEKIPGGTLDECELIPGVVMNKDVTHTGMKRRIEKPRVILLDCNLEYKKGENMTNIEVTRPEHWEQIMQQEEEHVKKMCDAILKFKPNLVLTEKGVSDLAQHYFVKAGVTVLRRLKKTDNDRVARTTGATIVHDPEDLRESDVGTKCDLFEIKKIGDEYFSYITSSSAKACTLLLRGAGKDILNEIERNLQDALHVARNVALEPMLLPGGGATEMSVAAKLAEKAKSIAGVEQYPYALVGQALEVIPRTLIQNCGANVVRTMTALRAKHAAGGPESQYWGVDGERGTVVDMRTIGLMEPAAVKIQTLKTAVEAGCMLLKVDDIVSGLSQKNQGGGGSGQPAYNPEDYEG